MEYLIEILKKFRGVVSMSLVWWVGHWYFSNHLAGVVSNTPEAWKTTSHYMIFLFVLIVLCLIVRTRLVLTGIAAYGFAFAAQQVAFVFDKHTGVIDWAAEHIAPMFVGLRYIADQIGFGLGELAECGLGAFTGLFLGVVACAAWCFVTPGDGSNIISSAKSRRQSNHHGHAPSSGVADPLSRRASHSDGTTRAPRTTGDHTARAPRSTEGTPIRRSADGTPVRRPAPQRPATGEPTRRAPAQRPAVDGQTRRVSTPRPTEGEGATRPATYRRTTTGAHVAPKAPKDE